MPTSLPAATARLRDAGFGDAARQARDLAEAVTGRDCRFGPVALSPQEADRLEALVARRLAGEPLQHLTGVAHFRRERLAVGPGVFVPRPETEVLAGWVIARLGEHAGVAPPVVVELCAGSGAISRAIATEAPGCRQYAVELDDAALAYLERNLAGTEVDVVPGDMAAALPELAGGVDVVVANPPYIPLEAWESVPREVRDFDPALALFSGDDGLDAMRVLAGVGARLLRPGGLLAAEHAEVQHEAVVALFAAAGYAHVADHRDLTDRWRFVTAQWVAGRPLRDWMSA